MTNGENITKRLHSLLLWWVLICAALPVTLCAEAFTLFTYHEKPPYYFSGLPFSDSGIYSEFVKYLNNKQKILTIELSFQPRKRLENLLKSKKMKGAIVGVAPAWFRDKEKEKYLWSSAFMQDKDIVVTRKGNLFEYKHPNDLIGKSMALPRGLYYWGVTELVAENKIKLYETSSDVQNLEMVLLGRADATITSMLTFNYFVKSKFPVDNFIVLDVPHDQYGRMLLFPKSQEHVYRILNPIIQNSIDDPEWQALLHKY